MKLFDGLYDNQDDLILSSKNPIPITKKAILNIAFNLLLIKSNFLDFYKFLISFDVTTL